MQALMTMVQFQWRTGVPCSADRADSNMELHRAVEGDGGASLGLGVGRAGPGLD